MSGTSRISGQLVSVVVPSASSAAAISLSTLFFAPLTVTVPRSRAPPVTSNRSFTATQCNALPHQQRQQPLHSAPQGAQAAAPNRSHARLFNAPLLYDAPFTQSPTLHPRRYPSPKVLLVTQGASHQRRPYAQKVLKVRSELPRQAPGRLLFLPPRVGLCAITNFSVLTFACFSHYVSNCGRHYVTHYFYAWLQQLLRKVSAIEE